MKNVVFLLALTPIVLYGGGCKKQADAQELSAPSSQSKESSKMTQEIKELIVETTQDGTGDTPQKGDVVRVHYTGTLTDGTKFDSSRDRGEPIKFTLGVGQVIQGWDQGLMQMRVGQKAKLHIPHSMAYGERGAGNVIPPFSDLFFDVELVEIVK